MPHGTPLRDQILRGSGASSRDCADLIALLDDYLRCCRTLVLFAPGPTAISSPQDARDILLDQWVLSAPAKRALVTFADACPAGVLPYPENSCALCAWLGDNGLTIPVPPAGGGDLTDATGKPLGLDPAHTLWWLRAASVIHLPCRIWTPGSP